MGISKTAAVDSTRKPKAEANFPSQPVVLQLYRASGGLKKSNSGAHG